MAVKLTLKQINLALLVSLLGIAALLILTTSLWIDTYPELNTPIYIVPIFASVISLVVMGLFLTDSVEDTDQMKTRAITIVLIILLGMTIRIFLAFNPRFNHDITSYDIVSDIVTGGGNVYAETDRYNYSPIWFLILGLLKQIQGIPFHGLVRSVVSLVDLATVAVLVSLARVRKLSPLKTISLFFLNPVSFMVSGYHGQFDNLSVLVLLVGILISLKVPERSSRRFWGWFFATAALIIKHIIFYETTILVLATIRRRWVQFLALALSVALFLASFLPYLNSPEALDGIIHNVFLYSADQRFPYGLRLFLNVNYTPLFIGALFLFPFALRNPNLLKRCLFGVLFFLTFTPGYGIQYYVLPIALGALAPSDGFWLYTISGTLFMLGSYLNVNLLNHLPPTVVWATAVYWFILMNPRIQSEGSLHLVKMTLRFALARNHASFLGFGAIGAGILAAIASILITQVPVSRSTLPMLGAMSSVTLIVVGISLLIFAGSSPYDSNGGIGDTSQSSSAPST